MNVKYEFLAPTTTPSSSESNSIYFDQVLLRRLQEETSGSPVLLNTRTETSLPIEFQLNGRGGNSPFRFTTTTASPGSSTIIADSSVVTTTSTTTTTTTTATTTTTSTTNTTAASSSSASAPQRRLSSTELLKLCFSRGIGCDFSQNEVYTNPTTEALATTTTTTTTTARPSLSKDAKQRLKQKVMLCFFQGICSEEDERLPRRSSSTTTRSPPSTTTSTTRRPAASRREEISARIRERARACFFQGIC